MEYLKLAKEIESEIINNRRELHKIPEINLDLPKTSEYIKKKLDEYGINYWTCVDGNGIVAEIKGAFEGKCIAIRADMDGLPIKEETGLEFASLNGNMHACGHDGHVAMALGAAKIISENQDKIKGHVKILFQPGEEYPGGAKLMIEEGCLENPKVNAIIGLHEGNILDGCNKGSILISNDVMMASVDRFYVKIIGKGAHGANYSLGIDPITIAAQLINNLQLIISREIPPTEDKVLSVCQIHGGSSQNIIPNEVFIEGTVRATNEDVRNYIARRIKEVSEGVCSTNKARCEVTYEYMYPVLRNNSDFTDFFIKTAENIIDKNKIVKIKKISMSGDDFSFYAQKTNGVYFFLCNPKENKNNGKIYSHHNSKFDVDESYFKIGTSLLVGTTIEYLKCYS